MDNIDHIALAVKDIPSSVTWYTANFKCEVAYQDDTWAMLRFGNIKLALVVPHQHPPHVALVSAEATRFGELKPHRDGTRSVYIKDPAGNSIEVLAAD